MAVSPSWHICTPPFLQMTDVSVRSWGKEEKLSGYLRSKLDIPNLLMFPNHPFLWGQGIFLALDS